MMGGRAAEAMVFDDITTGASDDIEKATDVARAMVTKFGMSDLGPINFDGRRSFYEQKEISPEMEAKIDAQVKKIADEAYSNATKVLTKLRKKLDKLADELLKKETIESDEFTLLVGPKKGLVIAKVKAQ
jgi:cell division protease FtsH